MSSIELQVVLTCGAFLAIALLLGFTRGAVAKLPVHTNQIRKAQKAISYGGAALFVTLSIVIWADEIREAALVLSAFAVAIVLSTKELIMCVTGWWLKLAGGHFRIGDRVQIGSTTGDVLDYGLLTIALLEVDASSPRQQRTGGVITLPNSTLLTQSVTNQTFALSFRWHSVHIVVGEDEEWQEVEKFLLAAGDVAWKRYEEDASRELQALSDEFAVPLEQRRPRAFLGHDTSGKVTLDLRIGLPVREGDQVEDQILRTFYSLKSEAVSSKDAPA